MIAALPGSPAFRALEVIVDHPGELGAEEVALHVYPPRRRDTPFRSVEDFNAWRAERRRSEKDANAKASRLIRRLQEAGWVQPCGAPCLAQWFVERVARNGLVSVIERAHPSWPSSVPDLRGHRRMAEEVAQGPGSVRDLLGTSPSGARKRVYADLVAMHVIVAPTRRLPTAAGVRRVLEHRAAMAATA